MKKVSMIVGLLVLFMGTSVSFSFALQPTTQWFQSEVGEFPCANVCFDPESGNMVIVPWWGTQCDWGFSTCKPVDCNLSCRDLLRLGLY